MYLIKTKNQGEGPSHSQEFACMYEGNLAELSCEVQTDTSWIFYGQPDFPFSQKCKLCGIRNKLIAEIIIVST